VERYRRLAMKEQARRKNIEALTEALQQIVASMRELAELPFRWQAGVFCSLFQSPKAGPRASLLPPP
jgi:hypothetical protein